MSRDIIRNIKIYRERRKCSQKSLAEMSGLGESTIKKIESGETSPRVNSLRSIAKALEVKLSDLLEPVRELSLVRFRAQKKMRSRESIIAESVAWLDSYCFLEDKLNDTNEFLLKDILNSGVSDPVELAKEARRKVGLKEKEPIHDICGLLENIGVKVKTVNIASEGFFGLAVGLSDGGPAVVINTHSTISIERWIFSAAHELGHILLHLDAFNPDRTDENENEENEANKFASYFLMPDEGFQNEWADTAGLSWIHRILKVKRIFRVSYKTVLLRLIETGKVSKDNAWSQFFGMYKRMYGVSLSQKKEPMGMEGADFYPDRFPSLIRKAVGREEISVSKAAEMLKLPIAEMMDRVREWEGTF